jgi:hypothetical protein
MGPSSGAWQKSFPASVPKMAIGNVGCSGRPDLRHRSRGRVSVESGFTYHLGAERKVEHGWRLTVVKVAWDSGRGTILCIRVHASKRTPQLAIPAESLSWMKMVNHLRVGTQHWS